MHEVPYPAENRRRSEFEIQAELYNQLQEEGLNVRGEVKAYKSRLDIVVFDDDNQAILIIETKSWSRKKKRTETKQLKKYKRLFDIPVLVCGRLSQINETVEKVINIYQEHYIDNLL